MWHYTGVMVATRFAVAVHILLLIAAEGGTERATSLRIARSVNTNPVVVRRIAGQLARAGLIRVRRGPGGAELARSSTEISLADVWGAVNGAGRRLLPIHTRSDPACPVGGRVREVLDPAFGAAEDALQEVLARTKLDSLVRGLSPSAILPRPAVRVS